MEWIHYALIAADLVGFLVLLGLLVVLWGVIRETRIGTAPLWRYQRQYEQQEHDSEADPAEPEQEERPLLKRSG
ncbi:MAG: hypothetical protein OXD46_16640 [Chloroflexi bacterium]|nr:hypothetical protein [Chloroflexota bacterium]